MRLPALELRVGVHTGPVISGIVGSRRFSFDIWGDTVNTASFMEAHCLPGQINISETVAGHVKALLNWNRAKSSKQNTNACIECSFLIV